MLFYTRCVVKQPISYWFIRSLTSSSVEDWSQNDNISVGLVQSYTLSFDLFASLSQNFLKCHAFLVDSMGCQLISFEGLPVGVDHVFACYVRRFEFVPGDTSVLLYFDHSSDFVAFLKPLLRSDAWGNVPDLDRCDPLGTECLEQLLMGANTRRLLSDDNNLGDHGSGSDFPVVEKCYYVRKAVALGDFMYLRSCLRGWTIWSRLSCWFIQFFLILAFNELTNEKDEQDFYNSMPWAASMP